jgi:hypothetical protein
VESLKFEDLPTFLWLCQIILDFFSKAIYLGSVVMQALWFILLSASLRDGDGFFYTTLAKVTYLEYLIKVCVAVELSLMGCPYSDPII